MAYRLIAKFDDQTRRTTLRAGRNVIGSDPDCDIYLPNPTVSRRHAALTVDDGSLALEDLGSTNGTVLRSERIERTELEVGDLFLVGRVVAFLEEIPDEDLETGVFVPRELFDPSGSITVGKADRTESFSLLDRFVLDHLPRLTRELAAGSDRERLAQLVGHALYETMPVTAVEILDVGDGEAGTIFCGSREEAAKSDNWLEVSAGDHRIRARFFRKGTDDHYRPLIDSALAMLAVADRRRGRRPPDLPPPDPAQRPQPPTNEPEVQTIYDQAERVARGDVGVLICGESGTGKEVLARFLHSASPRAREPLVTINCASLPRDLLEAELFGVEKGVATGVEARPGKFEAAHGGTLFLDEIGDMALETQAKILRVLQEQEVFRIGGHTPRPAHARVVAATNRPIRQMLKDGSFRSDLYHRIATWEVELPPLRRRRGDISNLAVHFLAQEARQLGLRVRGISRAALKALQRYRWPGNIRQLKNEIARAVLFLEDRELLDTGRLSEEILGSRPIETAAPLAQVLEAVEREEIVAVLDACAGDVNAACERLQLSRPTFYRRIKKLQIEVPNGSQRGD